MNELPNFPTNYNVAPRQLAPVVRVGPLIGARHLDLLRWGLLPYWTKEPRTAPRPIHAKAETVTTIRMFRDAFARRRCLMPAAAFYEQSKGQSFPVARADGAPLALAGIWEGWRAPGSGEIERTFCIITTDANALMAPIHDRMPVVIEPADWPVWLGEVDGDPAALLRPAGEDVLRVVVDQHARVNAPQNDDASLIEPIESAQ